MKHLVQNDVKNIQIPSLLHEMQIYLICHFQHMQSNHMWIHTVSTVQCTKESAFSLSLFAHFLEETVSGADLRCKLKGLSFLALLF